MATPTEGSPFSPLIPGRPGGPTAPGCPLNPGLPGSPCKSLKLLAMSCHIKQTFGNVLSYMLLPMLGQTRFYTNA